ncbi:MAG: hypothetical protein CSYNP_03995 [Syntrophus sp. SKADARSKE-3]|nr:hypothetical protein [Syntrophus sp. SKADARSKE-3]
MNEELYVKNAVELLKQKDASDLLYRHSLSTASVALSIAIVAVPDGIISRQDIFKIGLLHDIGKASGSFCADALWKRLEDMQTVQELESLLKHPIWGSDWLVRIEPLKPFAPFVMAHHEKPDSSGYPAGLSLDDIHPVTRVINIADRFSSSAIETRPYREGPLELEEVIEMLRHDIKAFFPRRHLAVIDAM